MIMGRERTGERRGMRVLSGRGTWTELGRGIFRALFAMAAAGIFFALFVAAK